MGNANINMMYDMINTLENDIDKHDIINWLLKGDYTLCGFIARF